MEKNRRTLKEALNKLPHYSPGEGVWASLNQQLNELPLKTAAKSLPEYEPDDRLWNQIELGPKVGRTAYFWRYAAAVILLAGVAAGWFVSQKTGKQIAFTQEMVDERLQTNADLVTDQQYEKLKTYCETETLICKSNDYKRLQHEYEELVGAAVQLQQAIGEYNAEPDLVRQFANIEQQKAEVLNEMAKMI
ncbi:hypothetical protein [Dyadobacter sp. CY347]|uniref:hypothetical protein n=1 Tax=Dyadobacter sp. CY347 TaxID=2909336 RepID=UPI001F3D40B7|nr:hypothetical protein [Dyadobacter sp. CY347]MCF2491059.1 hypothetical protein [Dyadobacter sp. CY347]